MQYHQYNAMTFKTMQNHIDTMQFHAVPYDDMQYNMHLGPKNCNDKDI